MEGELLVISPVPERQETGRVQRGLPEELGRGGVNAVQVSLLKENMRKFLDQLKEILDAGSAAVGLYEVHQVEISAQITSEGKIGLLGSGLQVGVQGGLKFILTLPKA